MIPIGIAALVITFILRFTVLKGAQFTGGAKLTFLVAFLIAIVLLFIQRVLARRKD